MAEFSAVGALAISWSMDDTSIHANSRQRHAAYNSGTGSLSFPRITAAISVATFSE